MSKMLIQFSPSPGLVSASFPQKPQGKSWLGEGILVQFRTREGT